MKFYNFGAMLLLSATCGLANAGDIAYGTLKGIKVYDMSNQKVTKLFFNSNATHQDEESCDGVANITHSRHDEATAQKMMSIALSGYMAGKKVRAYSKIAGSCEIDLISVQATYF